MIDVVSLGELLIDFTCQSIDEGGYPTMAAHPGGAVANFLAAVSRRGGKTALIGKVGNDAFGKLLLDTLEQKLLEKYYAIPLASTADCFLLSEKLHCYTGDYNALYGFGGLRLLQYDYTDAQWQAKTEQ